MRIALALLIATIGLIASLTAEAATPAASSGTAEDPRAMQEVNVFAQRLKTEREDHQLHIRDYRSRK